MPFQRSMRASVAAVALATLAGCSSGSSGSFSSPEGVGAGAASRAVRIAQLVDARGVPFVGTPEAWATASHRSVGAGIASISPRKTAKWVASVFVSDFTANTVYQFAPKKNGKVLGKITDVVNPQGLDYDSKGNLWVASTGNSTVREYAPGTYAAATVLNDSGYYPVSVAVCPNGTVYVSNAFDLSNLPGNIEIYAAGSTSPTGVVTDANMYSPRFVACDSSNTLYFNYVNYSYGASVASYNGSTVTEYGSLGLGFPGGIRAAANKTTLGIDDPYAGVKLFTKSNLSAGAYATIKGFGQPISFSFNKKQTDVWVADSQNLDVVEASLKSTVAATLGTGTLVLPIDAFDIPPGNS